MGFAQSLLDNSGPESQPCLRQGHWGPSSGSSILRSRGKLFSVLRREARPPDSEASLWWAEAGRHKSAGSCAAASCLKAPQIPGLQNQVHLLDLISVPFGALKAAQPGSEAPALHSFFTTAPGSHSGFPQSPGKASTMT